MPFETLEGEPVIETANNEASEKIEVLPKINAPADLKLLSEIELETLAAEIREKIIEVVAKNGGHLAPSLGAVELTLGIHRALNCPDDKLVWDVGHQAYAHKLITGRRDAFSTIRTLGGLSGFPKRNESPYDSHDAGHASSSIGIALGLAKARDLVGGKHNVVAVIGDGALTGGVAFEALNQAGHAGSKLIIVLNDNEKSIATNVGAFSTYLSQLRMDPTYSKLRKLSDDFIKGLPLVGAAVYQLEKQMRDGFKHLFVPGMIFEELGFRYFGPVDGHDIAAVENSVRLAIQSDKPVIIHTLTKKGKGYEPAEENFEKFHGVSPFDRENGGAVKKSAVPHYTEIFGNALTELAESNEKISAITAAMCSGTGLARFNRTFPERFFDVGIAEQEAVTFAAGMATAGRLPVVAVYSTFLQRAYDQVVVDVCLQNMPVIFAIDRAGLVGEDGPTHHGAFDISYLRCIPNLVLMSPKDENELRDMLYSATLYNKPTAIRYPRGEAEGVVVNETFTKIEIGDGEILAEGKDVLIIAVGRMVGQAVKAEALLKERGISPTIVNARFIKPLPEDMILDLAKEHKIVVTIEENALQGGFGSAILELLSDSDIARPVIRLGLPDKFIEHGKVSELLMKVGLNPEAISWAIENSLKQDAKRSSFQRNERS